MRALPRSLPLRLRHNNSRPGVRPSLAMPSLPAVEKTPPGQGPASVGFTAEDSSPAARRGRTALPHREDCAMAAQSSAGLHGGNAEESVEDGQWKLIL